MRSTYYSKDKRKYSDLSYESKYLLDPKYMTKRDLQHYYRYYSTAKGGKQFKKIIFILICICFFAYIFVDYNLRTKIIKLRDRFDVLERVEDTEYNATQSYFVDTPGCRMPYFNVVDNNILQFMKKPDNFTCSKPLTRTSDTGAQLWLNIVDADELLQRYNISDLALIRCQYTEIRRKNDYVNERLRTLPFQLACNKPVDVASGIEFILVECFNADDQAIYKDFHFFVLDKSNKQKKRKWYTQQKLTNQTVAEGDFERLSFPPQQHTTATPEADSYERISTMVLGIDSVSHLNFLRQMPHTAAYIREHLPHVEFWGHNKVGDNTFPNLVPLLSGLDADELEVSCLVPFRSVSFDRCPWIWKRFKNAGYMTAIAEDMAQLSLFNFNRPGFKQQPADYYLRPIIREMEKVSTKSGLNTFLCLGGRRSVDILLEQIRKLVPYLQQQDFFSFFWTTTLTHDYLNMPRLLDDDMVKLFQQFESTGIFNKTIVFLMTDHGMRWGSFRSTYQGMIEERQPLLMTLYPKWFKSKYAQAVANLELNSRRLTTFFDIYASMLDLVDLRKLHAQSLKARSIEISEADSTPRSISLFLPVPPSRTCEQAGIASHWCTCHQHREMQTNDERAQRAARYLVKLINDRLKAHTPCRTLYLNSIMQASIAAPHHRILGNITNDYSIDITLRIQTKPGLGLFESTVRMSSYAILLTGTISRLNLYASQSYCIDDYALKMFCYCHR